jgi:hypothetical protein
MACNNSALDGGRQRMKLFDPIEMIEDGIL